MRQDWGDLPPCGQSNGRGSDPRNDAEGVRAPVGPSVYAWLKRTVDLALSGTFLLILAPVLAVLAAAIAVESRGGVLYRCRRVGRGGGDLMVFKFRKMRAGAAGPALTAPQDPRFTRMGRFLAWSKLDEVPQLWNVLKGEMSLVGPRPEDPVFVDLYRREYDEILKVKPGITGLAQLAFAKESEILDPDDRLSDYVGRILPQKLAIDRLYVQRSAFWIDLRIIGWTILAVLARRDVAVDRATGRLGVRRRRVPTSVAALSDSAHIGERPVLRESTGES